MTAPGVLADPRVRLGAGTAALLVTAVAVHHDRVGPDETAVFRAINGLPGSLYRPAWAVMQLGTLGAAPATAAAAWLAGDRELAGRLLAGGTGAWALSKVVKRLVRRPRPAALLPGTHRRGREATGLGYLSGHAGVAVALGAAALPRLGPAGRALTLGAVPAVGLTRIYVGAHLPLDVAGGAALGLVIDAALTLASPAWRAGHPGRMSRRTASPPTVVCGGDHAYRAERPSSPGPRAVAGAPPPGPGSDVTTRLLQPSEREMSRYPADHAGLEILPYDECLRLLGTVPLGRVSFRADGEIVVLPVNHVMDGHDPVFRTAPGSKLSAAEGQDVVAFEADGYDERARSGWSVLVNGRAHAIYEEPEIQRLGRLGLRPWVDAADRPFWIRIRATSITGRRTPDPGDGQER